MAFEGIDGPPALKIPKYDKRERCEKKNTLIVHKRIDKREKERKRKRERERERERERKKKKAKSITLLYLIVKMILLVNYKIAFRFARLHTYIVALSQKEPYTENPIYFVCVTFMKALFKMLTIRHISSNISLFAKEINLIK